MTQKKCNNFANFCAEKFHDLGAECAILRHNKRDMRIDVGRFVRRTCGKCTGALRARFANIATSLHKFKQFKFENNNLIFLDAIFARAQREPRARILRKQTHHRLNQHLRLLRAVSATMPADFWCVAAPKMQKNCKHFANFCAEKLRDLGAERDILRRRRLRRPKRKLK